MTGQINRSYSPAPQNADIQSTYANSGPQSNATQITGVGGNFQNFTRSLTFRVMREHKVRNGKASDVEIARANDLSLTTAIDAEEKAKGKVTEAEKKKSALISQVETE